MDEKKVSVSRNSSDPEKKIFYYPNGSIWKIETHCEGKLHGIQKIYKRDGTIFSVLMFQNGKIILQGEAVPDQ